MVNQVTIKYINEGGFECLAIIKQPDRISHVWYSSKRNILGKYDRNEVTVFGAFMSKLKKGCKLISVIQE